MSDHFDIPDDLDRNLDQDLVTLANRLHGGRPVPRAAFRGDLRRRIVVGDRPRLSPARIRALIVTYALAGTVLLGFGLVSAAGVGPLG